MSRLWVFLVMKLVRSWPIDPPEDHPQIFDDCELVYIDAVDYTPLLQLNDNVLHLDWDVAVGRNELRAFAAKCKAEPELVRVAPTMNYVTRHFRSRKNFPTTTQWMVWKQTGGGRESINPGDPACDYFAFGMVYLPLWALKQYKTDCPRERFYDQSFSKWHFKYHGGYGTSPGVPVEWDTHAVHLNYSIAQALNDQE